MQNSDPMKSFASDNYSGVHPDIMEALRVANEGHVGAYGNDPLSAKCIAKFKKIFGQQTEVYLVYNGTGANVTGLTALTQSFNAILCSELAHIIVDESTAPERFAGCRLIGIPAKNGKITPEEIARHITRLGDQHHPQARVISISQATEYGTVYTADEIRAIAKVARSHNLYLHVDGARICNAAVTLDTPFPSFTCDAGVDVLSFGGTKNGLMFGEVVLIFNPELATTFQYIRKQATQLHSKMRFIAAQYDALLTNDLWKRSARHANDMAKRLESGLHGIPSVTITQSVDANSVFAILPPEIIPEIQKELFFYVWNDETSECRLMCSFDTTEQDVSRFVTLVREHAGV